MSRLLAEFDTQLKNLNRNIGFLDKEAIMFSELNLQMRIYSVFAILGLMMILLGVLL